MKPISVELVFLISFFSTRLLPGCGGGGNEGYEIVVEFPEPVLEYQNVTHILRIFLLTPVGNYAACQDLTSGAHQLGDDRYLINDERGMMGPFSKNPYLRNVPLNETETWLVFIEGEDINGSAILRGCTMLNPGDNNHKLTLLLVAL
jgi:hypothetical protein